PDEREECRDKRGHSIDVPVRRNVLARIEARDHQPLEIVAAHWSLRDDHSECGSNGHEDEVDQVRDPGNVERVEPWPPCGEPVDAGRHDGPPATDSGGAASRLRPRPATTAR